MYYTAFHMKEPNTKISYSVLVCQLGNMCNRTKFHFSSVVFSINQLFYIKELGAYHLYINHINRRTKRIVQIGLIV